MEALRNEKEFRQHKLALGLWESEGGAPAPHVPSESARVQKTCGTVFETRATSGTVPHNPPRVIRTKRNPSVTCNTTDTPMRQRVGFPGAEEARHQA